MFFFKQNNYNLNLHFADIIFFQKEGETMVKKGNKALVYPVRKEQVLWEVYLFLSAEPKM